MGDSLARDWVAQSAEYLEIAHEAFRKGWFPVGVRQAQTSVELSLKAALRWVGIDHPHEHDVADALRASIERFPGEIRKELEAILPLSSELARQRELALYGLEREAKPPSEVFTDRSQTHRFLELAERALATVRHLMAARTD